MVVKNPFHTKLCRTAEQNQSPCSENVQLRYKTNGGRKQSGLWRSSWTAFLVPWPRRKNRVSSFHTIWKSGPEYITFLSFKASTNCLASHNLTLHGKVKSRALMSVKVKESSVWEMTRSIQASTKYRPFQLACGVVRDQSPPAEPRAGKAPVLGLIQLLCRVGAVLPALGFPWSSW